MQRSVNQPRIPEQPTEQEVQEHNMAHIPFKPWCQDEHHLESHSSAAFFSGVFQVWHADRGTDEYLTVLFDV